jgi:hypothetical protein
MIRHHRAPEPPPVFQPSTTAGTSSANRIEKANPDWKRQGTVTLRFTSQLDEVGLQDVHDRVRREAKLDREIHDVLSRANVAEKTIHINLKESKVSDPIEIRDILLECGLTLVSSGEARGVLELIDKLSYADKNLPRILLIRAFFETSQGHYQMASGYLVAASVRSSDLAESDRLLLGLLRDVCEYHAGRITRAEYIRRQKELAEKDNGEFGLSRKVEYLWEALAEDGTRRGVAVHLPELKSVVSQVLAREDCSESLRIQARTALLYGEGVRFNQRFHHDLAMLKSRMSLGRVVNARAVFDGINADLAQWTSEANAVVQAARNHGNPHLIGDACYTRSLIMFGQYSCAGSWLSDEAIARQLEHVKTQLIPDITRAVECYQLSGHIEWALRAKLLLADAAALTGDHDLAKRTAGEVLPVAQAYEFESIAKNAHDHLAGDPFFRQMQRKFLTKQDDGPDLREAKYSDEEVARYAEDVLEASGLPRDRLEVITREVNSFRDIARERVSWCRHIQLIQDLQHTASPQTYYASDPLRYCYCERFDLRSKVGHTDWHVLIEAFKKACCTGCSARSPKDDSNSAS